MEKKEFPKKEFNKDFVFKPKGGPKAGGPKTGGGGVAGESKVPGLSNRSFGIIKLVLGICLLPFVYTYSISLLESLRAIDPQLQRYFWTGVLSFLLTYLFVIEPAKIYQQGQKLLEIIFHFFSPLVKVAPYVLPIYSIIIFFIYVLLSLFIKSKDLIGYFIFIFGFSVALHLVFSAKTLRSKQDFLKSNYIFGFSLVYLINLILIGLLLNLLFEQFSFVRFFNSGFRLASDIMKAVFTQLFKP